ncbi:hypothetical protein ACVIQT_002059 [Bradyrhizobium diazoefficiens]
MATISFVALYAYVGLATYEYHLTQNKLVALDQLLALRRLTAFSNAVTTRPARAKDLPSFFSVARSEALDDDLAEFNKEDGKSSDPSKPSRFDDAPIDASYVAVDVPMRMAVNGVCDVLITQLSPGVTFTVVTALIVGEVSSVKSEDTRLASFHGCQPGPDGDFEALILKLDDGQYAFAVSSVLDEVFLGPRKSQTFANFPLERPERINELVPAVLQKYFKLKGNFVFLHARAVDFLILRFANEQLGRHLTPDRLDDAVEQLYGQKEKDAAYFGINASSTQLIRIGPLIYFVLSFDLWRRVRRLPRGRLQSDKYWFAFETRDYLGRIYAFLCATAPVLFGVVVYAVFAVSQGLGIVLFGRYVTLTGLLTLTFPAAYGYGWYSFDTFAMAVLLFVPIQFVMLILIAKKLSIVVAANLRP